MKKIIISCLIVVVIFSVIIFAIFCFNNIYSCNKEKLSLEISNMCQKYDVGFYYKNPYNMESLCYNESKQYDPASTNKTFLALFVFKMIKEGNIEFSEVLEYKEQHKYDGTGEIQYGNFGDKYTVDQLLELLITKSDNVAFRMLKERVTEENLKNFLASIGTPIETEKVTYQDFSPKDLIRHLEVLYDLISEDSYISDKAKLYFSTGIYNDKIPAGVPNLRVLHKPGWIPEKLICNDEAIVYDENNQPYFLAIMSQDIPETEQPAFFQKLTAKIHKYHCLNK